MTDSWWGSTERVAVPAGRTVRGSVRPPGSKSLTHRAFAAALLARQTVEIVAPLESEDTGLFERALRALGFTVETAAGIRIVGPPASAPLAASFDCGNAGTLLRLLVALVSTLPGEWLLDGEPRLRERPIGPLVDALRELGAGVVYQQADGFAPVRVTGGSLDGGRVRLDAGESSQYLSALLLAGQAARAPIEIEVERLTSSPYVGLTTDVVAAFGGVVERPAPTIWRTRPSSLRGGRFEVEADLSAAAYPAAAAALTGGEVVVVGVRLTSHQGDRRLLRLLAGAGAEVEPVAEGVRVRGRDLSALAVDASDIPDQVPTLAALAPFCRGTTRISNVAHLRLKESDRLAAMASELRRAGAEVEERDDGLVIPGVWADREPPDEPVEIDPHGDHRIAMAMALVGLRRPRLAVGNPGVVSKSWPGFWRSLAVLLGERSAAAEPA